jgi:hypothetical protein
MTTSDTPKTPSSLTSPGLVGRRSRLVALLPAHYPAIYQLAVQENVAAFRWRHRGNIPSYEAFVQSLYSSVLIQFAVTSTREQSGIFGLVVAYNANPIDQTTYLAVLSQAKYGAATMEGVLLFVRYILAFWPFRKLYVELPEYNLPQFATAVKAGLLVEEGRLFENSYYSDRYWDKLIMSISREAAREHLDRWSFLLEEEIDSSRPMETP